MNTEKENVSSRDRKDPAWKYSVQVDIAGGEKTYVYLKCNFCEKVVKGGVTRMKEHLACSRKNVAPCAQVPDGIKAEIQAYMSNAKKSKNLARQQFEDRVDIGSYFGSFRGSSSAMPSQSGPSIRGTRGPLDQFMINPEVAGVEQIHPTTSAVAKEVRKKICQDIGRFFYENAIPFNVATSPAYFSMVRSIGSFGRGFKPPSMYELRTWILKEELASTDRAIDDIKKTWPQTGVTLMSDGWSDIKNRSLINILVNNSYGTVFLRSVDASDKIKDANYIFDLLNGVIEEIGEHLVVQVITDNASAYKAAGHRLMDRRPHLYWTPCAAHCLDLILEKLGDLPQHQNALGKAKKISKFIYNHSWVLALMRKFSKSELIRPAPTRFATAYLTLQSILDARQPLEAMFTSSQWLQSPWAKKAEGKVVRKIILNERFWASVRYAIITTRPLVQVLRMVDSEKGPAMGFIYNAIDEAKELIAQNLGGDLASYKEIWDIIDEKWEHQLHRHLHAAANYLNPQFQYATYTSNHPEIVLGLYHCMDRLIPNPDERAKADLQLVPFKNREDFFGLQQARDTVSKRTPVEWWSQFGVGTPELQTFAVKILGLTCSSSACERNWSTYNQVHTKRRNRLSTLRMNSLVYIMYNRKLKEKREKKKTLKEGSDPLIYDDVASDDDWFVDDAGEEITAAQLRLEDLNVDCYSTERPTTTSTVTKSKGKRKNAEIEKELGEEDWEDMESTGDENMEKTIPYADDSNEDPLSDDSD